jgi:hypothetical protein
MTQMEPVRSKSVSTRRLAALVLAAFMAVLFGASAAKAGCAVPFKPGTHPPFIGHPADGDWDGPATIVGLWHLEYTATSSTSGPIPFPVVPPGTFPFLESYKIWHADGTEWENAFMAPVGGNICFGVWKESNNGKVKLHHIGLMFDSASGNISFVFTVDEVNVVAKDGKTYSGNFDFKLFAASDVYGTGTPLQEVKGTAAGTRITLPKSDD